MTISHIPRVLVLSLVAVTLFAANQSKGEGEAHLDIVLKDHINHDWSNELVTYRLTFGPGECHKSFVELVGPQGSIPFQLSDVQEDDKGFVASARTSFSHRASRSRDVRMSQVRCTSFRCLDAARAQRSAPVKCLRRPALDDPFPSLGRRRESGQVEGSLWSRRKEKVQTCAD